MSRVLLKNKKGGDYCLLSPKEKVKKCRLELDEGIKYTNFGTKKLDEKGNTIKLGQREVGFRQGVISNYIDNTRIWLKKTGKYDESKDSRYKNKK